MPISQPGKVGVGRASASRSGLLGHSAGASAGKPGAFSDFLGRPDSILFRKVLCVEHVGLCPAGWRSLGFLSWFVRHRPAQGGLVPGHALNFLLPPNPHRRVFLGGIWSGLSRAEPVPSLPCGWRQRIQVVFYCSYSRYFSTVLSLKSKPLTVIFQVLHDARAGHFPFASRDPGFPLLQAVPGLRRRPWGVVVWLQGGSGQRLSAAGEWGQGRGGVWVSPEPSLCGHRGCVSASFRAILCLHHSPCFWWLLCPLALSPGVVVVLEISTSL